MLEGFDPQLEWIKEKQALRVGVGDQYFDVAQGPTTEHGQTFEVLTSGQYRFNVGASIVGSPGQKDPKNPWKKPDPVVQYKSPYDTMRDAVRQSALTGRSLISVITEGHHSYDPGIGTSVGGALLYGPSDTEVSRQEMASRVAIGTTPGTYMGDVLRQVRREADLGVGGFSHIQQYYPHSQDDQVTRMIKQPYTTGNMYLSLRGDPNKDIKGRNVLYNYRQTVGLFQKRQSDDRIVPLQAQNFTEQTVRPQWAKGSAILPGETRARSSLMLNEFITAAPFMSGAGAMYTNLLSHTGADSARRVSSKLINLPFENIEEFESSRFKMNKPFRGGVIEAGTSAEVGKIYYKRREDVIGSIYGSGQAITSSSEQYSSMVKAYDKGSGYLDYGDLRYKVSSQFEGEKGSKQRMYTFTPEESVYRVNIQAGAGDVAINSATLMMPRGFDAKTGELSAFEGGDRTLSTEALAKERMAEFRGNAIALRRTGGDAFSLRLDTLNTVSPSLKVGGAKTGTNLLEGLNTWAGRTANIAGRDVRIDLYNPEVKSPASRMISAMNAMTRKQQISALSLLEGGAELALRADAEFAGKKLNMDRLAEMAGTTPYELAGEILERIVTEKDTNKQKLIMQTTGIGVGEARVPYAINADMVDYYKDYFTQNAEAMGIDPTKLFGKGGNVQFDMAWGKKKGREGSVLMTVKSRGIFMRTANQLVSEDPGRAVTNYEMMRAIRSRYEKSATFLGLGAEQGWEATGTDDPATAAMQQIARTHAYNMSEYSDAGARLIDPDEASDLLAEIDGLSGNLTEVEKTRAMQKILGDQPLRFRTVGKQMFSPKAALGVDADVMGVSVTKMANLYNNTIRQMLDAESTADPDEALNVLTGFGSSYSNMVSRIGRMVNQNRLGKGTKNRLNARTSPGSIGGRYALLEGLNANEIYMPDDQLKRMLRDAGVDGAGNLKKAMAQINERGYLPAFFMRQPVLSSEHGAPPVKIVTRDILAKRGFKMPDANDPFTKGISAFVPTNITQKLAGDYDFDPDSIIGAFRWRKGKLRYADDADEQLRKDLMRSNQEILKDTRFSLEAQFGQQAGEFDIHNDSVGDYLEANFKEKGYPFKSVQAKWRELNPLQTEAERQIKNVTGMGTAYSARRRLEAASAALGTFSKTDEISSLDQMTKLYQQYLDKTRNTLTNLEEMFNSVYLEGDQSGGMFMRMKTGPGSNDFIKRQGGRGFTRKVQSAVVYALSQDFLSGKQPIQSQSMAFMLSSGSENLEAMKAVIEQNKEGGAGDLMRAINKQISQAGYDFSRTPLGVSIMSEAIQKSYRTVVPGTTTLRSDSLANTSIFWGQKTGPEEGTEYARTLDEMALYDDTLANQRVMYTALSSKRVLLPEEINRMVELSRRTGGELPTHIANQFGDWNTEMSQRVGSTANAVRDKAREYIMERAPIQLNASALGTIAYADPSKINGLRMPTEHGGTTLASNALDHLSNVLPSLYRVTKLAGEPLVRGNLVEKAYAHRYGSGEQTGLGYHIGDKMRIHEYAKTPDGRHVRFTGVPDFVEVNDEGIVISDMKSSNRSLNDLQTDVGYKTQLQTYAQVMTSLSRKSEGRKFLREVFTDWGFNEEDIEKAIEHAKEKRVTGKLAVYKGDVTPGEVKAGADFSSLDMGDMYSEGIGKRAVMASQNIIDAIPGALNLISAMAGSGRSLQMGEVSFSLSKNPAAVTRMAEDARRMLERHGTISPELAVMRPGHQTARDNPEDVYGSGVTGVGPAKPKMDMQEVPIPATSMRPDEIMYIDPSGRPTVGPTQASSNRPTDQMAEHQQAAQSAAPQVPIVEVSFGNRPRDSRVANRLQLEGYAAVKQLQEFAPQLHSETRLAMGQAMGWSPEQIENMPYEELHEAVFGGGANAPSRQEIRASFRRLKPAYELAAKLEDVAGSALRASGAADDFEFETEAIKEFYQSSDPRTPGGAIAQVRPTYESGKDLGIFKGVEKGETALRRFNEELGKVTETVKAANDEFDRNMKGGAVRSRADQLRSVRTKIGELSVEQEQLMTDIAGSRAMGVRPDAAKEYRLEQVTGELSRNRYRAEELEEGLFKRGGKQAGAALRRLFGGFSLMWMGSMLGWGMENMAYGAQEQEAYRSALEQQSMGLGGGGDVTQSIQVAQLRQKLAGGGIVGRQMLMDQAEMSPAVQNIAGVAKTGGGIYAAGQFIGATIGGPIGGAIASMAAPAAGIAALGALGYQGLAYARNPNETATAILSANARGDTLGSGWTTGLAGIGSMLQTVASGGQMMSPSGFNDIWTQKAEDLRADLQKVQAGRIPSGQFSQVELAQAYAATETKFEAYDPTLVASTWLFSQAGGIGTSNMENMLKAQVAGVDPRSYGAGRSAAWGEMPTTQNVARYGQYAPTSLEQARLNQAGQQFMQGLVGTRAHEQLFGAATTPEERTRLENLSTQMVYSPNYGAYSSQLQMAENMANWGMNYSIPTLEEGLAWGPQGRAALRQASLLNTRAIGVSQQFTSMTGDIGAGGNLAMAALGGGAQGMRMMENLLNFNPTAMAVAAQGGAGNMNSMITRQVRETYGANGVPLGMASLPAFTMDMGLGSWSPEQVAGMVWGGDWQSDDPYGLRSAAVTGGFRGMQSAYRQQAAGLSAAGAGIAMRGAELSYAFQTGIGLGGYGTVNPVTGQQFNLPSGGIWGVQDAQRDLSREQQQWNFQYQEQSMAMQKSQFYDNQALQQRQMTMQRGFARRGWEFQDQMTDLQWGWQQEDFAEESRFMTGRARKKAERQMERATITHELQGERTEEVRSQQEELWDLEDERFSQTRQHFEEQMDLQEENFDKMKEFYEERVKLEDQMQELQRAYFIEQNGLQKESAGLQAAQAALQREMAEEQEKMNQFLEDQQGRLELQRVTWTDVMEIFVQAAEKMAEILDMDFDTSGWGSSGGDTGGNTPIELPPGTPDPEDDTMIPTSLNPWNDEIIPIKSNNGATGSMLTNVVVRIGDQEVRDFIVETVNMEM